MDSQPDSSAGMTTAARLFIVALLSFYFLGYSPFLSICLGAIAGVCGGFIASWWNAKKDYTRDETAQTVSAEAVAITVTRKSRPTPHGRGVKLARQTRSAGVKKRFGWLFRRDRS